MFRCRPASVRVLIIAANLILTSSHQELRIVHETKLAIWIRDFYFDSHALVSACGYAFFSNHTRDTDNSKPQDRTVKLSGINIPASKLKIYLYL